MSDDFLKGIGRFIPPELRRFAPTFRAAAELLKPNPIVNNPSTANILTQIILQLVCNIGH